MKIKGSYIWAALILVTIGGWLYSGQFAQKNVEIGKGLPEIKIYPRARVRVQDFQAGMRAGKLVIRGRTEAVSRVQVRAETGGQVMALAVKKGERVKKGALLCKLDMDERLSSLVQAEAALAQARLDYTAARELFSRGFSPETRKVAHKAKLDAAKAAVAQSKLDIKRTEIKAPFDGAVEAQPAKQGDLLQPGGICATLVKQDPLFVTGQAGERDIGKINTGMPGYAVLVTGETIKGRIRFISPSADPATRTFKVELEAPNPDGKLRFGVTARIEIPLTPEKAHLFPPSLLALNDKGVTGVRAVDENDIVRFWPVHILSDGRKGMWVGGLPEKITLIIAGQNYVKAGQKVQPVRLTAEAGS